MPRVEASTAGKEDGKSNVAPEIYNQRQEVVKNQRYSCILRKGIKT